MKDFEQALAVIDSYIPEQSKRMRVLRNDAAVWDFFLARLDILEAEQLPAVAELVISPVADPAPLEIPKNVSQLIKSLEDDNKLLLKNQAHQHSQLVMIGRSSTGDPIHLSVADKEKRKALRDIIVNYEESIRKNWHAIRHVQIYGSLPPAPEPVRSIRSIELPVLNDMENNRNNIRYLKKQIARKKKELPSVPAGKLIKAHASLDKLENNLTERIQKQEAWQALKRKS